MRSPRCSLLVLALLAHAALALVASPRLAPPRSAPRHAAVTAQEREPLSLTVDLKPLGKARIRWQPIFAASEAVGVTYPLPFELNVEQKGGLAVVTKDGPGGEKAGDVLRYCSEWKIAPKGQGSGGALETVASFSGRKPHHSPATSRHPARPRLSACNWRAVMEWKVGIFDVNKAKGWEEVVEALTSNEKSRTDQIVLAFEREVRQASV